MASPSRVAGGYGLDVFDVQFRREAPGMVLRVQIDRPGPASKEEDSVGVADCASVSRDLSAIFDVEEVVPTAPRSKSRPGLTGGRRRAPTTTGVLPAASRRS